MFITHGAKQLCQAKSNQHRAASDFVWAFVVAVVWFWVFVGWLGFVPFLCAPRKVANVYYPLLVEERAHAIQNSLEEMALLFLSVCWHEVLCYLKKKKRGRVDKRHES